MQVRSDENPIGILNWHFPKRCWDARLTVNTSDYVNNDVQEAAQEIVDNLRICLTPDRKSFDLGTKINSGYLQINSINLHRETSHLSTEHPDILLHLSEVSDLNVWQPSGPKGPYEASLNLQQNMIGNAPKTWCQVSLSSIAATTIFKENSKLELGYIASWTAENILATQAVKELCYVARDVVTRIDSVGYLNMGPKGGSGTRASENVKKVDNFFW